ncbi:hypothetical protein EIP91_010335 [Steccherinum ochraceum]|uniref:Zn(2)-C6 fungal-type domain-containing protein n=1 Tax=Steccherinum ochraceum TaxID=92696 RepID=A0A4R0R8N5_9APHY|nr:hypothetical protein EIP91_010335 [Steccherinum ochraceum]
MADIKKTYPAKPMPTNLSEAELALRVHAARVQAALRVFPSIPEAERVMWTAKLMGELRSAAQIWGKTTPVPRCHVSVGAAVLTVKGHYKDTEYVFDQAYYESLVDQWTNGANQHRRYVGDLGGVDLGENQWWKLPDPTPVPKVVPTAKKAGAGSSKKPTPAVRPSPSVQDSRSRSAARSDKSTRAGTSEGASRMDEDEVSAGDSEEEAKVQKGKKKASAKDEAKEKKKQPDRGKGLPKPILSVGYHGKGPVPVIDTRKNSKITEEELKLFDWPNFKSLVRCANCVHREVDCWMDYHNGRQTCLSCRFHKLGCSFTRTPSSMQGGKQADLNQDARELLMWHALQYQRAAQGKPLDTDPPQLYGDNTSGDDEEEEVKPKPRRKIVARKTTAVPDSEEEDTEVVAKPIKKPAPTPAPKKKPVAKKVAPKKGRAGKAKADSDDDAVAAPKELPRRRSSRHTTADADDKAKAKAREETVDEDGADGALGENDMDVDEPVAPRRKVSRSSSRAREFVGINQRAGKRARESVDEDPAQEPASPTAAPPVKRAKTKAATPLAPQPIATPSAFDQAISYVSPDAGNPPNSPVVGDHATPRDTPVHDVVTTTPPFDIADIPILLRNAGLPVSSALREWIAAKVPPPRDDLEAERDRVYEGKISALAEFHGMMYGRLQAKYELAVGGQQRSDTAQSVVMSRVLHLLTTASSDRVSSVPAQIAPRPRPPPSRSVSPMNEDRRSDAGAGSPPAIAMEPIGETRDVPAVPMDEDRRSDAGSGTPPPDPNGKGRDSLVLLPEVQEPDLATKSTSPSPPSPPNAKTQATPRALTPAIAPPPSPPASPREGIPAVPLASAPTEEVPSAVVGQDVVPPGPGPATKPSPPPATERPEADQPSASSRDENNTGNGKDAEGSSANADGK